jgi:hypothetical protein
MDLSATIIQAMAFSAFSRRVAEAAEKSQNVSPTLQSNRFANPFL